MDTGTLVRFRYLTCTRQGGGYPLPDEGQRLLRHQRTLAGFTSRYTDEDIRLLATTDELPETPCGYAVKKHYERAHPVFGQKQSQQLGTISASNLYNMRRSTTYVAADAVLETKTPVLESRTTAAPPKAKAGRKPLPADLPSTRIERDLPEEEKRCACTCERVVIGEDTSDQLDIIPATIPVLVNVRKKYACRACKNGVQLAPLPPQPIPTKSRRFGRK